MVYSQACVLGQLALVMIATIGLAGLSLVTFACCLLAWTSSQIHPINSDYRPLLTSKVSPRCSLRGELFQISRWNHSNPTIVPFHWLLIGKYSILWIINVRIFNANQLVRYRCCANPFTEVIGSYSTLWQWSQGSRRSAYCCYVSTYTWLPLKITEDCAVTIFNWASIPAVLPGNLFQVVRSHHWIQCCFRISKRADSPIRFYVMSLMGTFQLVSCKGEGSWSSIALLVFLVAYGINIGRMTWDSQ